MKNSRSVLKWLSKKTRQGKTKGEPLQCRHHKQEVKERTHASKWTEDIGLKMARRDRLVLVQRVVAVNAQSTIVSRIMLFCFVVAGRVDQPIDTSRGTGTVSRCWGAVVPVGLVRTREVEFGHLRVFPARRVIHKEGLSCIEWCEVIDFMAHFFCASFVSRRR